MGTLVNPIGWRANSLSYWKSNFFVHDSAFPYQTNLGVTHVQQLNSILSFLNTLFFRYGAIKFLNYQLLYSNNKAVALVSFRFHTLRLVRVWKKNRRKFFRQYRWAHRKLNLQKTKFLDKLNDKEAMRSFKLSLARKVPKRNKNFIRARNDIRLSKEQEKRSFYEKVFTYWNRKKIRKSKRLWKAKQDLRSYNQGNRNIRFIRHTRIVFPSFRQPLERVIRTKRYRRQRPFIKRKRFVQFLQLFHKKKHKKLSKRFVERSSRLEKLLNARYNKGTSLPKLAVGDDLAAKRKNSISYHRARKFRFLNKIFKYVKLKKRRASLLEKVFGVKKTQQLPTRAWGLKRFKRIARFPNWRTALQDFRFARRKTYVPRKIFKQIKRKSILVRYTDRRIAKDYKAFRYCLLRRPYVYRYQFDIKRLKNFAKKFFVYFILAPLLIKLKIFIKNSLAATSNRAGVFEVYFLGQTHMFSVTADSLLNYVSHILKRSGRMWKINKLLYRILRVFNVFRVRYGWRGFKFLLAGRFTRRDRATFIWRTKYAVPLSTKLASIDYAIKPIQLKYSKTVARLWICRN